MMSVIEKIKEFYCARCCWPYSAAFYVTLGIYWMDRSSSFPAASFSAFSILAAYYLYNVSQYRNGTLGESAFFIWFLTFKISVWGLLLIFVLML
jgi:hypothetical protein